MKIVNLLKLNGSRFPRVAQIGKPKLWFLYNKFMIMQRLDNIGFPGVMSARTSHKHSNHHRLMVIYHHVWPQHITTGTFGLLLPPCYVFLMNEAKVSFRKWYLPQNPQNVSILLMLSALYVVVDLWTVQKFIRFNQRIAS